MDIFFTTLQSVFTLLGIGIIGFWIISKKIIPAEVISVLSPLAIDIALPCLVFANIMTKFDPEKINQWWLLPIWWMGFTGWLLILTMLFSLISNKQFKNEFRVSLFYQNGLFLPLAIIMGMNSRDNSLLVSLFLFMLLYPAFFFNSYRIFFKKNDTFTFDKRMLERTLNPVLIATLVALILVISGLNSCLPEFIIKISATIGNMAVPLIILIIGGSIYIDFQKKERIYWLEILKFILCKNFLFPAFALAAIYLIKPEYNLALIIAIEASVPPITAVPIVVEREKGNTGIANQYLIASFITAVVSLPTVIYFFNKIYQ
ncbi:MAG TPA: AEC family transporter [Spirochaetota bacterium]|nr:AEC family transporter [Spirochaetota bacterium]